MFYNGIFLEVSYNFNEKSASMTFEKLAATALKTLEPEIEEIQVSIYHSIETFEYTMKGYIEGIKMPIYYSVSSTKNRFEESITDTEGNILFFRHGKTWDKKFFGVENWTSEPLQELHNISEMKKINVILRTNNPQDLQQN